MTTWRSTGVMERTLMRAVEADVSRRATNVRTEAERAAARVLARRTGTYLRAFRSRKGRSGSATAVVFEIVNTAPHSRHIEYGTRRHVIRPRRPGGLLRFSIGGRVVFARKVNHPGTKPYAVLRGALERRYRP